MKKTILVPRQGQAMLDDALRQIQQPSRRLFLQRSLTLGGLSLLTGCNVNDASSIDTALTAVSRFNDKVQGWLFDPNKLAPTYPDSMITRPFPFNAYYGEDEVEEVDGDAWRLELSGLIADKKPWSLPQLRALPQETQVTRHICVEGWSAIGKWAACRFPISSSGWAPTRRRNTSASSAPTIILRASTWPRPCIRKPSWP